MTSNCGAATKRRTMTPPIEPGIAASARTSEVPAADPGAIPKNRRIVGTATKPPPTPTSAPRMLAATPTTNKPAEETIERSMLSDEPPSAPPVSSGRGRLAVRADRRLVGGARIEQLGGVRLSGLEAGDDFEGAKRRTLTLYRDRGKFAHDEVVLHLVVCRLADDDLTAFGDVV